MNTLIILLPWLTLIVSLMQMVLNLPSVIKDAHGLLDTMQKRKRVEVIQRDKSSCVKYLSMSNNDSPNEIIASS